jgi:hypothetical protein
MRFTELHFCTHSWRNGPSFPTLEARLSFSSFGGHHNFTLGHLSTSRGIGMVLYTISQLCVHLGGGIRPFSCAETLVEAA